VDVDLDVWKQTLVARAYTQFIGPQLTRQQAALQNITEQVLAFWEAVQAACHWLAELVWSLRTRQTKSRTPIHDTLRLLIIDPKRNAFHTLRNSPFLWRPIVFPDEHSAVDILTELAEEMDRRYRIAQGADSFAQMVTQSNAPLPRIVCVCDEYRDLISRNREQRKGIEGQICRLGAKARAAGIHLILATQEPSRDTITGPLDSNIPARVGLKMGKSLESKMLLNQSGAEKLLGNGDLLFRDIGQPRRLQAPLLTPGNLAEIFGQK
jgi:S-DNA-T family DNA segregation ATPase FtsK/SpoIIIE